MDGGGPKRARDGFFFNRMRYHNIKHTLKIIIRLIYELPIRGLFLNFIVIIIKARLKFDIDD